MKNLYQITDNVFWMPFPKKDIISELSTYLNQKYGHHYYIWNLSEHDYEKNYFQNQVSIHSYKGFACPPLYELLLICKCMMEWIQNDGNVAIIHCQQNKGRSAILLSLFWSFSFNLDIEESYYIISKQIQVNQLLKSHTLYIRYLKQLLSKQLLNTQQIKVKSIILSSIPNKFKCFRPLFQIQNRESIIYEEKQQQIEQNQQCIFILPNIPITQDIVFKCKHITQNDDLIPIFRFQINTSFIDKNIMRFNIQDLDLTVQFEEDFTIDLVCLIGNDQFQEIQKEQQCDLQSKEGVNILLKLVGACELLSQNIEFNLYKENIIQTNYLEQQIIQNNEIQDIEDTFSQTIIHQKSLPQQIEMINVENQIQQQQQQINNDQEDDGDYDDIII